MSEGTLAATGDAIVARSPLVLEGQDGFDDLLAVLRGADAAVTQVEPVLVDDDCRHASFRQVRDQYHSPAPFPGTVMGTDPAVLDGLQALGLNLFTAASNHAADFGMDGLERTLAAFRVRDLPVAGIGERRGDARAPVYADTDAGRVGLVDATTSVPPGWEAGVSSDEFEGGPGVNPLHVEWTYRVPADQLSRLRTIAETAGIESVKGEWLRRTNPDWKNDDGFYFMGLRFEAATDQRPPGIYQSLDECDRRAVLDSVRVADAESDFVVAGVHCHQAAGGDRNTAETPRFLRQFSRDAVDAGANLVVGTGPHALRGIELYDGSAICYSLGNFCFQEEAIYRVPDVRDDQVDAGVPAVRGGATGGETDSGDDVSHDADNWRSVVPECEYVDGSVSSATLYPVTLQPRADPPERGLPVRATGEQAREILQTVADRSEPFGTTVSIEGEVAHVEVTR